MANFVKLVVETEEGNVAVFKFVFFAFKAVFAGFAGSGGAAGGNEVIIGDYVGFDESFFKIGMDDAGTLGSFHAFAEGPGAYFLLAGGEVGGKAEEVVGGADEEGDSGIANAERFEIFSGLGGVEIDEFGFNGGRDNTDARTVVFAGVGLDFLDKGILVRICEVAFGNIAGVEDGFGAEEAEALEGKALFVREVEGDGGFVFVKVREKAVDEFDVFSSFLIAPAGFFNALFFLAFEGGKVGKDEFSINDLDIAEGIDGTHVVDDVFVLETTNDMNDGINLANVGEEFVAKALAFAGSGDEAGDIDEFDGGGNDAVGFGDFAEGFEAGVGHLNDADVGIDGTKGVVGGLGFTGTGERVEEGTLSNVRETDYSSL